ncbi:AGE family epimerase/isomerase [Enterobacter cloacae subsp. cloacae]|nr:AGE family epimerase/isomerase [Enterobacter cloacae subsp. cloacae]
MPLNGWLRDKQYGGWYACVNDEGVVDASQGYQHFFVLLGGERRHHRTSAGAQAADDAIEVIERYWSEQEQMCPSPRMKRSAKRKITAAVTLTCTPWKFLIVRRRNPRS